MSAAHASAVSRALARAGHDRAESESTSIRGYHRYYPGFQVHQYDHGALVEHSTMDDSPDRDRTRGNTELRADALDRYTETLRAAGYGVELRAEAGMMRTPALLVTRP